VKLVAEDIVTNRNGIVTSYRDFYFQSVSSDQIPPSIYTNEENTRAKSGRMKRIGIEISVTIRYKFVTMFEFRYESLRFLIRFMRPSLVPVISSFVYIVGGIWSDKTDWHRNLSSSIRYDSLRFRYDFPNFVTNLSGGDDAGGEECRNISSEIALLRQ